MRTRTPRRLVLWAGVLPTERYFPGIFHAMHWTVTTLLMQSQQSPRRPLARIVGLIWMFASIVFVALYTAQLTANLTLEQIRGDINGPENLPGKRIATLAPSTSDDYLRARGLTVQEFGTTEGMFKALLDNRVDAVLFSAPTLHYFAAHAGRGQVPLVGPEFDKSDLGFAVQINSPYRRAINAAVPTLREDGTCRRIYDKWFGAGW